VFSTRLLGLIKMKESVKEKIGIYKEVFKSLFNLFLITVSGSFALFSREKGSILALIGFGVSLWLALVLILLWRYMLNLVEEIEDDRSSN